MLLLLSMCVHFPVKGWFDDRVDKQPGREQAEEEAMSFNIPLSSPQYIHVGARHWHRKYGGWCYRLSLALSHMPFSLFCCHTQVQTLESNWEGTSSLILLPESTNNGKQQWKYTVKQKQESEFAVLILHIRDKVPISCVVHQINIQMLWFRLNHWSINRTKLI